MRALASSVVLLLVSTLIGIHAAGTNLPPITNEMKTTVLKEFAKNYPHCKISGKTYLSLEQFQHANQLLKTSRDVIDKGGREGVQLDVLYNDDWPVYVNDFSSYIVKVTIEDSMVLYQFINNYLQFNIRGILDEKEYWTRGFVSSFEWKPGPNEIRIPSKLIFDHSKVLKAADAVEAIEKDLGRKFYEAIYLAKYNFNHSVLDITPEPNKNGIKITSKATNVAFNVVVSKGDLLIYDDNLRVMFAWC